MSDPDSPQKPDPAKANKLRPPSDDSGSEESDGLGTTQKMTKLREGFDRRTKKSRFMRNM